MNKHSLFTPIMTLIIITTLISCGGEDVEPQCLSTNDSYYKIPGFNVCADTVFVLHDYNSANDKGSFTVHFGTWANRHRSEKILMRWDGSELPDDYTGSIQGLMDQGFFMSFGTQFFFGFNVADANGSGFFFDDLNQAQINLEVNEDSQTVTIQISGEAEARVYNTKSESVEIAHDGYFDYLANDLPFD